MNELNHTYSGDSALDDEIGIRERARRIDFQSQTCKGKLIVFEGVDGASKSTSLEHAYKYIKSKGIKVEKIDMLFPELRQLFYHRNYADDHTRALRGIVDQTSIGICALGDRL